MLGTGALTGSGRIGIDSLTIVISR